MDEAASPDGRYTASVVYRVPELIVQNDLAVVCLHRSDDPVDEEGRGVDENGVLALWNNQGDGVEMEWSGDRVLDIRGWEGDHNVRVATRWRDVTIRFQPPRAGGSAP